VQHLFLAHQAKALLLWDMLLFWIADKTKPTQRPWARESGFLGETHNAEG
jgi:hypothetical protein